MKKGLIFIIIILFCTCKQKSNKIIVLPFYNNPDWTPTWISQSSPDYSAIHTIPAFSFKNQNGQVVTKNNVAGKIYIANFFFTRCNGICPKMMHNMAILRDAFKYDSMILFLSHSVTPETDSVAVLKKYAISNKILAPQWQLLTGLKEAIYTIAKREYFAGDSVGYYQSGNEFLHTENFILMDKHARIRGVYNGTLLLEIERLKEDIFTLKMED